jgi:hypothetical protein
MKFNSKLNKNQSHINLFFKVNYKNKSIILNLYRNSRVALLPPDKSGVPYRLPYSPTGKADPGCEIYRRADRQDPPSCAHRFLD